MANGFKEARQSPITQLVPVTMQAACSMPTPVAPGVYGRCELVIGRLGAGKTTWGALRAKRIANASDRQLVTNGIGWPDEWGVMDSLDSLDSLRDSVLLWDEIHISMPSGRGFLTPKEEKRLIRIQSMFRKRRVCIIGTTQSWTRVATYYRQIASTVWRCAPYRPGVLHRAVAFDPPDDGGVQQLPQQWFGPAAARIPTNAEVWHAGMDYHEEDPARTDAPASVGPGFSWDAPST